MARPLYPGERGPSTQWLGGGWPGWCSQSRPGRVLAFVMMWLQHVLKLSILRKKKSLWQTVCKRSDGTWVVHVLVKVDKGNACRGCWVGKPPSWRQLTRIFWLWNLSAALHNFWRLLFLISEAEPSLYADIYKASQSVVKQAANKCRLMRKDDFFACYLKGGSDVEAPGMMYIACVHIRVHSLRVAM
jgi:hypothetical protein